MAWLAQCVGLAGIFANAVILFGIIFGSNWLFIVIAEEITEDLTAFNENTVQTLKDKINAIDRVKLMERFLDIIKIHSDAKQ